MRKFHLICGAAALGAAAALSGCSGAKVQNAYIATSGHVVVGAGNYKEGAWAEAYCDYSTGKMQIDTTHVTNPIAIKLPQNAVCDTTNKMMIVNIPVAHKDTAK